MSKSGSANLDQDIQRQLSVLTTGRGQFGAVPMGNTYLGQFIAHDIVSETTPRATSRMVTPELNLDSLYGTPSCNNAAMFDENGRFRIQSDDNKPDDLIRDFHGQAIIPELRNDENTIVSQLHLAFQKFHNRLIDDRYVFDKARESVIKSFQAIVVKDYLRIILERNIYDHYFPSGDSFFDLGERPIPKAFSLAAFRFGHSMVREDYDFSPNNTSVKLKDIFRRSQRLTNEMKVSWRNFFCEELILVLLDGMRPAARSAGLIDTNISTGMTALINHGVEMVNIIERNLISGRRSGLTSGLGFANSLRPLNNGGPFLSDFGFQPLTCTDLVSVNNRLSSNGFRKLDVHELHLWPYLLLESEKQETGSTLGVLGSVIVAETISKAIRNTSITIWNADSGFDSGQALIDVIVAHRLTTLGAQPESASENGLRIDYQAFLASKPSRMNALLEFVENKGD